MLSMNNRYARDIYTLNTYRKEDKKSHMLFILHTFSQNLIRDYLVGHSIYHFLYYRIGHKPKEYVSKMLWICSMKCQGIL